MNILQVCQSSLGSPLHMLCWSVADGVKMVSTSRKLEKNGELEMPQRSAASLSHVASLISHSL